MRRTKATRRINEYIHLLFEYPLLIGTHISSSSGINISSSCGLASAPVHPPTSRNPQSIQYPQPYATGCMGCLGSCLSLPANTAACLPACLPNRCIISIISIICNLLNVFALKIALAAGCCCRIPLFIDCKSRFQGDTFT